jgi:hypothetical protein
LPCFVAVAVLAAQLKATAKIALLAFGTENSFAGVAGTSGLIAEFGCGFAWLVALAGIKTGAAVTFLVRPAEHSFTG